jgi:surfeit locus 1 family protein
MDRRLLTPGLLAIHLLVLLVAVLFVRLGVWQLDRLEERRAENAVGERRLTAEPEPATSLLQGEPHPEKLEYRRVIAAGRFDPEHEVLIRSQTHLGNPGFHVITPLVTESDEAVMVNRGWVPIGFDEAPVVEAPPPDEIVTVEGWLHAGQTRPPLGRVEPEGRLAILNRVDLDRIEEQLPYPVYGMYMVEMGERADLPIPIDPPDFADEGPHLAYAIQWFAFALIGAVGYIAVLRRRLRRPQEGLVDMARSSTIS